MPDFSKVPLQRKSHAARVREQLVARYFGNWLRTAVTLFVAASAALVLTGAHYWGAYRAGEKGMEQSRRESLRIATEYIASPQFQRECVQPFRIAFQAAGLKYSASPQVVVDNVLRVLGVESNRQTVSFSRAPIRSVENYCVEILRNVREHLALRGYDVRAASRKSFFQRWYENVLVQGKLIDLEERYPGICPRSFPAGVPLTCELFSRAIANSLGVPPNEMGELINCAHLLTAGQSYDPAMLPTYLVGWTRLREQRVSLSAKRLSKEGSSPHSGGGALGVAPESAERIKALNMERHTQSIHP